MAVCGVAAWPYRDQGGRGFLEGASGRTGAITRLDLTVENCEITTKQRGITVYPNGNNGINLVVDNTKISLVNSDGSEYNYDTEYYNDGNYRGISLWEMGNSTVTVRNSTI